MGKVRALNVFCDLWWIDIVVGRFWCVCVCGWDGSAGAMKEGRTKKWETAGYLCCTVVAYVMKAAGFVGRLVLTLCGLQPVPAVGRFLHS